MFDFVVFGVYFGKGKCIFVYGVFLLVCYNFGMDMYEMVCNIGIGFSEVVFEELYV